MIVISSSANPHFKSLRQLMESSRERHRCGAIVLDGPHLVASLLRQGRRPDTIAVSADAVERTEISTLLQRCPDAKVLVFPPRLFRQLSPVQHPVGILAVAQMPQPETRRGLGGCTVLLDGVQDPGNVGAIIRTAAAAGAEEVLLSVGCADPWAPRTLRAGMGAQFTLGIRMGSHLSESLEGFDGTIVATVARGGQPPQAFDLTGPTAFLFGGEGAGLHETLQSRAGALVTIPMAPDVESLNVAAAAAILLFERVRQLNSYTVR